MKLKNKVKQILRICFLLMVIMGSSIIFSNEVYAGTQEGKLVSLANSQGGKRAADYGFDADWCAWFVEWCGYHSGLTDEGLFPGNKSIGKVTDLCNWYVDNDKGTIYYALPGAVHTNKNSQKISKSSFVPQKGDLICFTWNGAASERYDHVGIVTNYLNGIVYYTHGNSGGTGNYKSNWVRVNTSIAATNSAIAAYVRPNYSNDKSDPQFRKVWIDPHDHTVLMLKANITDDTGMGEVRAYYKRKDKGDWHSEQMIPQGNNEYWLCISAVDGYGLYDIHIYAYDTSNNLATWVETTAFDNTAPNIKKVWVEQDTPNFAMVKTSITDDVGIGAVELSYKLKSANSWHTEQMITQGNGEYWLCIANEDGSGEYEIQIKAYDMANHLTTSNTSVVLKNDSPIIEKVWFDPHDHTLLMLKAKITDDTGMGEVRAYYKRTDKADWHSEPMVPQGNGEYWLCINADDGYGKYAIHIYAYDKENNLSTYIVSTAFDNTAPKFEKIWYDKKISSEAIVKAKVTDDTGIESVNMLYKSRTSKEWHLAQMKLNESKEYYCGTVVEDDGDGEYNVKVVARDMACNEESYELTLDLQHVHKGGKASCSKKAICDICGKEYGELEDHQYNNVWTIDKEATYIKEGEKSHHCIKCDARKDITIIPIKTHNHSGGKATCSMLAVCDICGEQYGEYRHSYVMDEAVEATCTQTGKTEGRHCSVCGYVDVKQEIIKKKEHIWNEGITINEATIEKEGTKEYICGICGEKKLETIPFNNEKIDESLGEDNKEPNEDIEQSSSKNSAENNNSSEISDEKTDSCTNYDSKTNNGKNIKENGIEYSITDPIRKTLAVSKLQYASRGKIVIPEKVRINNKTYRVTVIRKSAFKNNKILHDIIIPSSVIIIESSAFENCRNLERVQIGKNVNAIGKNAFKNCKKLKTIVFKNSKLTKKKVGKNALKGVYKKTVIRVPKGMKKKYMFLKKKGLNEKQQKIM